MSKTVTLPGTEIESGEETVCVERFENASAAVRVVVVGGRVGGEILDGGFVMD